MSDLQLAPDTATQPNTAAVLTCDWEGSALKAESTFHQLSPYIGKLKSSICTFFDIFVVST